MHDTSNRIEQTAIAASEGSFWATVSDHRPLIADFKIVGGLRKGPKPLPPKPKHKLLQPELSNSIQMEKLHAVQNQWLNSNPIKLNPSDEEISQYLYEMTIIGNEAVQRLKKPGWHRNLRNNTYKGSWSPTMMITKKQIEIIWEIHYHVVGRRGRAKWTDVGEQSRGLVRLMKRWEKVADGYVYPEGINKWDLLEEGGYGPNFWRTYSKLLEESVVVDAMRIAKRMFHGKKRKEDSKLYSEFIKRQVELLDKKNYRRFIKSSLGEATEQYNLAYVNVDGETFTTNPMECHNIATEKMYNWHASPVYEEWTIHHKDFDWEGCTNDENLISEAAIKMNIPTVAAKTIAKAFHEAPLAQQVRAQLIVELANPPTFIEFYNEIRKKPNGKSGGVSESTYDNMKSWSDRYLQEVYDNLAKLWATKHIPQWWSKKYMCMVPKNPMDPGNLDTCRPITLVEVMRKVWMGIVVQKIKRVWEAFGILQPNQHAGRSFGGTHTATTETINIIEQAQESHADMYSTSWDIKRAFDSVSKNLQKIAYARLGVPAEIIDYIVDIDDNSQTFIRSPQATATMEKDGIKGFDPYSETDDKNTMNPQYIKTEREARDKVMFLVP